MLYTHVLLCSVHMHANYLVNILNIKYFAAIVVLFYHIYALIPEVFEREILQASHITFAYSFTVVTSSLGSIPVIYPH